MVTKNFKITKEEYEANKDKEYQEKNTFIKSKLPDYILCGYGYFGGRLKEEDGGYFIEAVVGRSCD